MPRARLLAGFLILALVLVLALPAAAAPRDGNPTRMQPRSGMPPATAPKDGSQAVPAAGVQGGIGICQCIADHSKRNISCLATAQECQSACATTHYSFVPFAPSCPITAR